MRLKRRIFTITVIVSMSIFVAFTLNAASDNKPDTHTSAWAGPEHGKAYKLNEAECATCHEDRTLCITCHEDKPPRSHNSAFVNRTHGLEAQWNKQDCKVCHKEDFCVHCHQISMPMNHTRANFRGDSLTGNMQGSHCQTSCQLPFGSWNNTQSKNCLVCHQTRPVIRTTGAQHPMN